VVVNALRLRQNGGCDLDQIVECQRPDRQWWRAIDRGEAIGQKRLGGDLDVMHQALKHIVEQRDLVVRKLDSAADEEVGHPAQRFNPAGNGSLRQRYLQFVE
jgi:hypothetical protein